MNKEYNEVAHSVKKALADYLGIEIEDVEDDFSLAEDLHMKPTDLTDFTETLVKMGFDIKETDFAEIETFSDLIDFLIR